MGSLGSGQHLNTAISILLALAQDTNCSSIRVGILYNNPLIIVDPITKLSYIFDQHHNSVSYTYCPQVKFNDAKERQNPKIFQN